MGYGIFVIEKQSYVFQVPAIYVVVEAIMCIICFPTLIWDEGRLYFFGYFVSSLVGFLFIIVLSQPFSNLEVYNCYLVILSCVSEFIYCFLNGIFVTVITAIRCSIDSTENVNGYLLFILGSRATMTIWVVFEMIRYRIDWYIYKRRSENLHLLPTPSQLTSDV